MERGRGGDRRARASAPLLPSPRDATLVHMERPLYIRNGRVIDPASGSDETRDLWVIDGRMALPPDSPPPDTRVIDASGLVVAPGLIDLHVHFREPGCEFSETLETGARAAATGGFTRVVTMPNTTPSMDSPEWVRRQVRATPPLPVRILPSACLTVDRRGTVPAELGALADAGAAAFTDDGSMITDDQVMAAVMREAGLLGKLVMDHAVDPRIAGKGVIRDCDLARRCALPVMPADAEVSAVARDIRLCRETGCPIHIQHISCSGTIDLIHGAQREGLPVSGEASPHHLALAAEEIPGDDGLYKMNPPLGNRADRQALREAVRDGILAALATDHAPHQAAAKRRGFVKAPFGVIGLETAVGVTYDALVRDTGMGLSDWLARWTTGPATLLGLPPPSLAPGACADLVLLQLDHPWQVSRAHLASKSTNCPFLGRTLTARSVMTLLEGRITFEVARPRTSQG